MFRLYDDRVSKIQLSQDSAAQGAQGNLADVRETKIKEEDMSLYEQIEDMTMFKDFSEKELKSFSKMGHVLEEYNRGDIIIEEGDESTAIYLLLKGSVLIVKKADGHTIRLAKLKPGEIFGEMSFFSKKIRHSDALANDDVQVLRMDSNFFEKVEPGIRDKVKNYFIELLVNRLDGMNESIMAVSKLMHTQ